MATFRTSAISGAFFSGVGQGVRFLTHAAAIVILARLLTPSDFGLTAMVYPIIFFAVTLQEAGLGAAVIQRRDISQKELNTVFWLNVLFGLVLAGALIASAPAISAFFREPRLTPLTMASGGLVLLGALAAQPMALLNREMKFRHIAVIDIASLICGLVVSVTVAYVFRTYWAIWLLSLASTGTTLILALVFSGWRPGLPGRFADVADLVRFGGHMTATDIFGHISRSLDKVLIGRVWGGDALGLYDRAYKLMMLPVFLITMPLKRVVVPLLVRTRSDPLRYRSIYLRSTQTSLLMVVPGIVVLVAAPYQVIDVLLGRKWLDAAPIFAWLSLGALVQSMHATLFWLYVTQERARDLSIIAIFGSTLTCGLYFVGLPWGAVGVAMAFACGEIIKAPFYFWWATRRGPVQLGQIVSASAPFALAAVASWAAVWGLCKALPIAPFPLVLLCGLVSYAVALLTVSLTPQGRTCLGDVLDYARTAIDTVGTRLRKPA